MNQASIPVDLFNPGQVFACMGFLEATEALRGDARGHFDWTDAAPPRFHITTSGDGNPFARVLEFLATCRIHAMGPADLETDLKVETFPSAKPEAMALPLRLEGRDGSHLEIGHWADGTHRDPFKLYSGNRSAKGIASKLLHGKLKASSKSGAQGAVEVQGMAQLWQKRQEQLIADPFSSLTPLEGTFNMDPRGAWTTRDAGYSPNDHAGIKVTGSPVVEILAAIGLEHARPLRSHRWTVRYGVWETPLPPLLARPCLSATPVGIPLRVFTFDLEAKGKNKMVTFATEEEIS